MGVSTLAILDIIQRLKEVVRQISKQDISNYILDIDMILASHIVAALSFVKEDKTLHSGAAGYLYVLLTIK